MIYFVTGAAGFIGSNFVRYLLEAQPDARIYSYDKNTYAGNSNRLDNLDSKRHEFIQGDLLDKNFLGSSLEDIKPDCVIHLAAESDVDRSIEDSQPFIRTNVHGTDNLLRTLTNISIDRYIQVSTDEVYGSLDDEGLFKSTDSLDPSNPYSATKASADLILNAYQETFTFPGVIVRATNNYGPRQHPEKFIPKMILRALKDEPLPIYGDGSHVRDWLYVNDFCRGLKKVAEEGTIGEIYHFGGDCEKTNLSIAKTILKKLGKPGSLIEFVEDRPGHDKRYALDFEETRQEFGWEPETSFNTGLKNTIDWYREHMDQDIEKTHH